MTDIIIGLCQPDDPNTSSIVTKPAPSVQTTDVTTPEPTSPLVSGPDVLGCDTFSKLHEPATPAPVKKHAGGRPRKPIPVPIPEPPPPPLPNTPEAVLAEMDVESHKEHPSPTRQRLLKDRYDGLVQREARADQISRDTRDKQISALTAQVESLTKESESLKTRQQNFEQLQSDRSAAISRADSLESQLKTVTPKLAASEKEMLGLKAFAALYFSKRTNSKEEMFSIGRHFHKTDPGLSLDAIYQAAGFDKEATEQWSLGWRQYSQMTSDELVDIYAGLPDHKSPLKEFIKILLSKRKDPIDVEKRLNARGAREAQEQRARAAQHDPNYQAPDNTDYMGQAVTRALDEARRPSVRVEEPEYPNEWSGHEFDDCDSFGVKRGGR